MDIIHTPTQRGDLAVFDVLVIGSGIAGLSFCLALLDLRPQTRIALISKTNLSESNSYYAQGGIAAVSQSTDSISQHMHDTLLSGDGLSYPSAVQAILSKAPDYILNLRRYGVLFDCTIDNHPDLAQEGGHTHRRIFHHGDQTGRAIIENLLYHTQKKQPYITFFENHMVVNLLTRHRNHPALYPGEVIGAYVLNIETGLIHTFLANVVVLATGGAGKIYRYTTNPDIATGDGLAMAYRIGARIDNLEFYQFHPTLLYHPIRRNFLISEAVRGEKGYLRLPDTGERFMQRYAPKEMELATRDVVARAIFTEMERGNYNYVHLDMTHRSKAFLQTRFPHIYETLFALGMDMCCDKIPVVPAAHYQCGGILTDMKGKTDKKRLYAIGEVACTGLHGANRLASNSLVEAGVMAIDAAQDCIRWINKPIRPEENIFFWDSQGVNDPRRASQIHAHWRSLRGEMTSYAGIVRTKAGLQDVMQLISARYQMIEAYYWQHTITRELLELRNIVLVAKLIIHSALKRRESRGGHYREDYPEQATQPYETILQIGSLDI